MSKIKIDKWDVYVGIFLAILFIVWLHSECDRTTELTATTSTSTTSSPTRPDFISVSLGDYPNWGNFKENYQLGGMRYQIDGVTFVIPDSLWVESEKSYPYCLFFIEKGNVVVEMLPVNSYRVISEDDVKSLSDSTVTTESATYWKPRYCIDEGSEYTVTDDYVVSVKPYKDKKKKTYWWWIGVILVGAGIIFGGAITYAGICDCDGGMIFIGLVIDVLLGWAMSSLVG